MNFDNFYYLDYQNFDKFKDTKIKLIKTPSDKTSLCKAGGKCCSCYFYTYYKTELLEKLKK